MKTTTKLLALAFIGISLFLFNSCRKEKTPCETNATVRKTICGYYMYALDGNKGGIFADSIYSINKFGIKLYDGERVEINYTPVPLGIACPMVTDLCGGLGGCQPTLNNVSACSCNERRLPVIVPLSRK